MNIHKSHCVRYGHTVVNRHWVRGRANRSTQRRTRDYQLGNATGWENPVLSEQALECPDLLVLRNGFPQEDILKEMRSGGWGAALPSLLFLSTESRISPGG